VASGSAFAQDVRVDVTGTNIKRVESEGALPVQIITREEIQRSGVQSSTELMNRISAVNSSGTFNEITGVGSSLTGFAGVSLRGLGVERTLVLLNGRRLSNYSIAGAAVDVNTIPVTAIERVEVLKDGASAVYGTDAVAGVINFIMRKDFTGLDAYAYYGDSDQGGGKQWRTTITGGWGDLAKDRFNVFGMYDYVKTDPITALQRSFSNTVYRPDIGMDSTSANVIPANIAQPGGFAGSRNPGAPGCLPPFSIVTTNSAICRFDFGATINITPPSEKQTVLGRFTWQINPDHQLLAEGSWYQGKFHLCHFADAGQ
jgi:iron complex outermembrane receptor protein